MEKMTPVSGRARLDLAVLKTRLASLPRGVPHTLFLGLTGRCDLACRHCKFRSAEPGPDMPPRAAARLLRQAAGLGIPRVVFFGGEPLMYQGLPGLVARAAGLGLYTELDTNGQRLTRRAARALAAAGLSSAMISLHSAEQRRHDALSGPGSFRRAVRAVAACRAAGLVTYISSCLFSGEVSVPSLAALAAFSRTCGAHGARLLAYSPSSGRTRLPARLAAALRDASPDAYARTCASPGGGCAASRGQVLFAGAAGEIRACPYAKKALGPASAGLAAFLPAGSRSGRGFPCHGPRVFAKIRP